MKRPLASLHGKLRETNGELGAVEFDFGSHAAAQGDPRAAEQLLPLLYDELHRLAHSYMNRQADGQTLQTTALVHEAYMRLVGHEDPGWNGRGHFFGAAAQAMRQILIEQARRKAALKHGGDAKRVDLDAFEPEIEQPSDDVLALNEALTELETSDPRKARLVLLCHFAGLTMPEAAAAMGISLSTAEREWALRPGRSCSPEFER